MEVKGIVQTEWYLCQLNYWSQAKMWPRVHFIENIVTSVTDCLYGQQYSIATKIEMKLGMTLLEMMLLAKPCCFVVGSGQ